MNDPAVIELIDVSKKYCKSLRRSMLYSMTDIFLNMTGRPSESGRLRKNEFWSLKNISLTITKGEMVGLIGPNGSGKTTFLKLLDGVFWPDQGEVRTRGKVGALISAGAGFHPMLSGRENIHLNGAVLGLSKHEIQKKFDQIVDFSEIEQFIDMPVKYYSSGMFVRLGLAIAVHCNPDILLVDEILSVGDQLFRNKCIKKIAEMKTLGTTVVFVTHNFDLIQMLCERVFVLHEGHLVFSGETHVAIAHYGKLMAEIKEARHPAAFSGLFDATQPFSDHISMLDIRIVNGQGLTTDSVVPGEDIIALYTFKIDCTVNQPRFSASIGTDLIENIIWNTNLQQNVEFGNVEPGTYTLKVKFIKPSLAPGVYRAALGVYDTHKGENMLNCRLQTSQFTVRGPIPLRGILACPSEWSLQKQS